MLRCAASLVVAAYPKVRLTPWDLRALSANFLRSRQCLLKDEENERKVSLYMIGERIS
jgi:hypothetical protein